MKPVRSAVSGFVRGRVLAATMLSAALLLTAWPAWAQYYKKPISDLDASIMRIDEDKFLGAKLRRDTQLIDATGRAFRFGDMLGQPLILVLAYYTCDGSCSVINSELVNLLAEVDRVKPGKDFRVLTLSFDANDTVQTTEAFKHALAIGEEYGEHWRIATFADREALKSETARIGFKFFWSPEDKIFLHPGTFLFLSPEGRLIRVLYAPEVEAGDIELAVFDAKQGQFRPQEIVNFAISLCYSYNFKEGKYTLSIPVFVGVGALLVGLSTLFIAITVFKRKRRQPLGDMENAHVA